LDVSIIDDSAGYYASVTSGNALTTASRLWDGTNYVTVTGNKLDVNATMSWSNSNKVVIWDGTTVPTVDTRGSKGALGVEILDASGNQITTFGTAWVNTNKVEIWDGTNTVAVDASGRITANRSWNLSSGSDSVSAVQSGTWNIVNVSGTISLPTGASTSALQTTGNSSLSSIDTKTPSLGQALMAASTPVVIASNQSTINIQGIGTIGSPAGGLLTVQGVGGGTALPISTSAAAFIGTVVQPTGTNLHTVVDSGTINAVPVDGAKTTFSAGVAGITVAATPTDVFTITGSATKTIRVTLIAIDGTETTATQRNVLLIKRSSANSGGTSTTLADVSHDSTNAAGTATVRYYTANPTLGTTVGTMRASRLYVGTTTSVSDEVVWDFGDRPAQAIVLRGTGDVLAVNLGGVTSAGNSFNMYIEWTEE
jgi:hypothetical protein